MRGFVKGLCVFLRARTLFSPPAANSNQKPLETAADASAHTDMYPSSVKTGTPMQRLRRKDLRPKKEVKASTLLSDRAIARAARQLAKANRRLNQR